MTLQDKALRLRDLEGQVVQAIDGHTENLHHMLGEYLELKASLKRKILDESAISVEDARAREVLRKIGEAVEEIDEADIEQLGSDLFYSWYCHQEFLRALAELRSLILRCDTPESVERLVEQIKRCYAFQQYDAAFALCRTLLEASIRDICVRRRLFPDLSANAVLYEKLTWYKLRNKVSTGDLNGKLEDLYTRLSKVLHARRTVMFNEARDVYLETLRVIEELYEVHKL